MVMNNALVGNTETGATFMELFNGYNANINIVFYCLFIFFSLFMLQYILLKNKNDISMPKEINNSNKKEDCLVFYTERKSLFFNILLLFIKIGTSLALFGAFEGILFLYTHYLPANAYYLCS